MNKKSQISIPFISSVLLLCLLSAAEAGQEALEKEAKSLFEMSRVKGGLVVHIGCGDGRLTSALRANNSFIVQGLDKSMRNIAAARKYIQSIGLYGDVSVDFWQGENLPYVDNFANLIVVENADEVSQKELLRVLVPNGVACIKNADGWAEIIKHRPEEMDEWTHYMHDSTGNAVSNDTLVGPPANLQWVGSPRWTRHHEHMSSLNALVSANGRIFYIVDEGSRASIQLPPKWYLVARDAFNGTILWKRAISLWYTHLYPLKSGPAFLPRRLVAVGDRVYVTLGLDQPLVALDAATGAEVWAEPKANTVASLIPGRIKGVDVVANKAGSIYRAADGKLLWANPHFHTGDTGWAPPTIIDDVFYLLWHGAGGLIVADFTGVAAGEEWKPKVRVIEMGTENRRPSGEWLDRWTAGSPLILGETVYAIDQYGVFYAADLKANKAIYRHETGFDEMHNYNAIGVGASATLGGKHIYVVDNQGMCVVLEPGPAWKPVAVNRKDF